MDRLTPIRRLLASGNRQVIMFGSSTREYKEFISKNFIEQAASFSADMNTLAESRNIKNSNFFESVYYVTWCHSISITNSGRSLSDIKKLSDLLTVEFNKIVFQVLAANGVSVLKRTAAARNIFEEANKKFNAYNISLERDKRESLENLSGEPYNLNKLEIFIKSYVGYEEIGKFKEEDFEIINFMMINYFVKTVALYARS